MNNKYKILIIDDEEVVLDSCTEVLRGSSYELATASDGTLGLALLDEFQPDLVFVDLKMPGMSGLEVLEQIHNLDPSIVTVVITGYATVSSAVEAMKFGAHDFMPKPFTPDEFRMITHRALEKRKLVLETLALRREKEMLRANFAAIVSHELKSPLSAVQQNLFVLSAELSGVVSDEQLNRLERMKIRISELLTLIRTWLRAISVDIETIKDGFTEVTVSALISTAIENVHSHAVRKDIDLISKINEPLPAILGDPVTLTEVLVNILNNAIKYSYAGSVVHIEAGDRAEQLCISITDTGVGISGEDLPFIFDDFYSGEHGPEHEKGYGLGLALSKRIIDIHNGSIEVRSESGRGSVFSVLLPAIESDSQPSEQPAVDAFSSRLEGELR